MQRQLFCLLSFTLSLFAEHTTSSSFPVRLTPEERAHREQKNPCCNQESNQGCDQDSCGKGGCRQVRCLPECCKPPSINCPPVRPRCDPCDCIIDYYNPLVFNGFDLGLELIVWTVEQKASTFALSPNGIHQPFPPSPTSDATGKYHSIDFDWSPGFRANLSYTFERDAWNLLGGYTYFSTKSSDRVTKPEDNTLYITATNRALNGSNTGLERISSSAHFDYEVIDFLLSRRFLPGCQILFTVFSGPTAAIISERWKVTSYDTADASPDVISKTKNKWRFSAGGMKMGVDSSWHIGSGFGLYNKLALATLIGAYKNSRKTSIEPAGHQNTLIPNLRNTHENETSVIPTTQIELGMNWNKRFCKWGISLQLALEVNSWYDLHQLHQDTQDPVAATHDHLDYRNSSSVHLWGASFQTNFSF